YVTYADDCHSSLGRPKIRSDDICKVTLGLLEDRVACWKHHGNEQQSRPYHIEVGSLPVKNCTLKGIDDSRHGIERIDTIQKLGPVTRRVSYQQFLFYE